MKHCAKLIALGLVCCASGSVFAAQHTTNNSRATAVFPDGSLQLESVGRATFANLRFPDATRAEEWLAAHMLQQPMAFEVGTIDRYGRTVITSDSEIKMLRDGAAIIYASEGEVPASWIASEAAARHSKTGVWAQEDLVIKSSDAVQHKNEFHVVEGTVTRVYNGKTATYVNFGEDWHSDFSITIPAKIRRSLGHRLDAIKQGSQVHVRGMLYEENGPMVTLVNAYNLEQF